MFMGADDRGFMDLGHFCLRRKCFDSTYFDYIGAACMKCRYNSRIELVIAKVLASVTGCWCLQRVPRLLSAALFHQILVRLA